MINAFAALVLLIIALVCAWSSGALQEEGRHSSAGVAALLAVVIGFCSWVVR